jgi:hypothetical protein
MWRISERWRQIKIALATKLKADSIWGIRNTVNFRIFSSRLLSENVNIVWNINHGTCDLLQPACLLPAIARAVSKVSRTAYWKEKI